MPENMFTLIMKRYQWKPIPGCPGRYILSQGISTLEIDEILGRRGDVREECFETVPDPVLYCYFEGGGLISYKKADGFLHTLCNTEGMERKMRSLKSC